MKQEFQPELLVSSSYGIYTAQTFCEWYADKIINKDELAEDIEICLTGPAHAEYWEAWEQIESKGILLNKGTRYRIESNEDLWAIPEDAEIPENWYI